MSPAPVAQTPVTLRPHVPRKWDLTEQVVRRTKEYLSRPCLLRMPETSYAETSYARNDTEREARDEQFAEKLRKFLDLHLAEQRRCLEAQYATSSLPVTFKTA